MKWCAAHHSINQQIRNQKQRRSFAWITNKRFTFNWRPPHLEIIIFHSVQVQAQQHCAPVAIVILLLCCCDLSFTYVNELYSLTISCFFVLWFVVILLAFLIINETQTCVCCFLELQLIQFRSLLVVLYFVESDCCRCLYLQVRSRA